MIKSFEKNYTENGYVMKYEKSKILYNFTNRVLQFKIEMKDIEPKIWRRILVSPDYNLWDLHVAIQDAMGWQDCHLHTFEFKQKRKKIIERVGIPDFESFHESEIVFPGWEISVLEYFNDLGVEAKYLYDFGDSWEHNVVLEGYIFKESKVKYPVCIDGERACPPEDCGGVPGYYELLETLSNPNAEEYKEIKEWVGKNWNSEQFEKKSVKFFDPYKRWINAFLKSNPN